MRQTNALANALGYDVADKRIDVLRLIGKTGSISQAAREAGISYKAAWQAIDTLSNLAGVSLVEKTVGGVGGGGAQLTPAGEHLLEMAHILACKRHELFSSITKSAHKPDPGLSRLFVRTSMRNHLPCHIHALSPTASIVRVALVLRDGTQVVARITHTSVELLALKVGTPVLALCKATAVSIRHKPEPSAGTSRNLLRGVVRRASRGDTEDEIAVELDAGVQLVGFSPASPSLSEGETAYAHVEESAVVIALL
ncbi:MAG: LysR family transcriptional regulator [Burkholderiaceae bacterium]|jgi:molybdate transport system regulatory protein|nr:LysR family transcriptional regulator [Burkholderiaceae bacterium]